MLEEELQVARVASGSGMLPGPASSTVEEGEQLQLELGRVYENLAEAEAEVSIR